MQQHNLDALIVCGNQYAGFEGAVLYTSGFEIVHRYVYVLIPLEGEPTLVFPREARFPAAGCVIVPPSANGSASVFTG